MCDLREIRNLVSEMEADAYAARDYAQAAVWLTEGDRPFTTEEVGVLHRIIADGLGHAERIAEAWIRVWNALPEDRQ